MMRLRSFRTIAAGAMLFAISLASMAIAVPRPFAILAGPAGALALALFLLTRHRVALTILIVQAIITFGFALCIALVLQRFALLGISAMQIAALALLDRRERFDWIAHEIAADQRAARNNRSRAPLQTLAE